MKQANTFHVKRICRNNATICYMNIEIEEFIDKYPDWYVENGKLVAGFEFKDFSGVQNLVSVIINSADELNHHPDVQFGYNTVEVKTVTHDEGNTITDKDFSLAKAISEAVLG